MPTENLITDATNLGLGAEQRAADMFKGTQLGVGLRAANLDASTPLVFPPTVLVVLQTPSMYNKEPQTAKMIKALVEGHAKSVSGIDFGYTLETSEQPVGHDGQNMQVPTKSKRSAVTPSLVFPEVNGNLVWNLFRQWMVDIQDPDTNASMARFDVGEDLVFMSSFYAMTMMAIQFDPTFRTKNIIDAALYTNMFPTDPGGQIGFERQISTSKTMERTVNFTGLVLHNKATRTLGIKIAEKLKFNDVRYDTLPTGENDEDPIDTHIADSGLQNELDTILNSEAQA